MMRITTHTRAWYSEPIVWLVIAIPLSSVVVGIFMITLALNSDDGLVADDYYQKGLEINRSLERDQKAVSYELSAVLNLHPAQRNIDVTLQGQNGFAPPEALRVDLYHATRQGLDKQVTLQRTEQGSYRGKLPQLQPGRWYIELEGQDWRLYAVTIIPQSAPVHLRSTSDRR